MALGNAPVAVPTSGYEVEPEMLVRDLLSSTAFSLAAAIRASLMLDAASDPIDFVNMALKQSGLAYRLEAIH